MQVQYTSGGKDVIYNDTVILYDEKSDIDIDIDCTPEYQLRFRIKFVFETTDKESDTNISVKTDKENSILIFKFCNVENPLGTQNMHPIEIATLGGKKAYFVFKISRPQNDVARILNYTIYRDK